MNSTISISRCGLPGARLTPVPPLNRLEGNNAQPGRIPATFGAARGSAAGDATMRIVDSHFHWRPRSVLERICKRKDFPVAAPNSKGGYVYRRRESGRPLSNVGGEWFDLDALLAHLDSLGHDFEVVCSIGPFSVAFSDFEAEDGGDAEKAPRPFPRHRRSAAGRHQGRDRGDGARGPSARPLRHESPRQHQD